MTLLARLALPLLRLALQEIARIQAILVAHGSNLDEAAVWDALERAPLPPLPGVVEAWLSGPVRQVERPFGTVFTLRSRFLGTDSREAYQAIVLPSGAVALGFPHTAAPDVAPVLNRFAAGRLFAEHGWRLPADLSQRKPFLALMDLLGLDGGGAPAEVPDAEAGEVALGAGRLVWSPRRLSIEVPR